MAITTRHAGVGCPVTVSGSNVTFAGWDVDWSRYANIVLDTWVVYNITRSASLVIHTKTGTESGGYTFGLTGDASAWQTGDLCVVSNSATFATHATIAALNTARGYLDTAILTYAATNRPHYHEAIDTTTKPIYFYGHLSRQRCSIYGGITASGDQSTNTTQVIWENFTVHQSVYGAHYNDSGAGKTGGGVIVRRVGFRGGVHANVAIYFQSAGANVCQAEFCTCEAVGNGFYALIAAKFYHCVAFRNTQQGFYNSSQASTYTNCAAMHCATDFATKTNGTYTTCASSDATGTAGLTSLTPAQFGFWMHNDNGFRIPSFRITTASSLYNAGTAVGGLTTDIDGTTIGAGTCPVGCHSGTVNAYGVTWPTAAQVADGVSFTTFSGTVTGTADASSQSSQSESSLSESSASESSQSTSSTTTSTSSSTESSLSSASSESSLSESSLSESSASESSASGGGGDDSSASESSASESTPSTSTSTSTSSSAGLSSSTSSTSAGSSSSSSESGPGDMTVNEYEDFLRDEGDSVTIERKTLTVTATGARVPAWTTVDTVFASIQPASSDDRAPFERRGIFVSHKVFIAEDPGVTEGDRIGRSSSVKYMIHGVKDVMDRGELWVLYCEEMKS